jgi:hypothetical protein
VTAEGEKQKRKRTFQYMDGHDWALQVKKHRCKMEVLCKEPIFADSGQSMSIWNIAPSDQTCNILKTGQVPMIRHEHANSTHPCLLAVKATPSGWLKARLGWIQYF